MFGNRMSPPPLLAQGVRAVLVMLLVGGSTSGQGVNVDRLGPATTVLIYERGQVVSELRRRRGIRGGPGHS